MNRILFVDDEPRALSTLERMLQDMTAGWEMAFVESGEKALEAMSRKPFDIVITDIAMPGMDGVELLMRVSQKYPQTVRIVLSGQKDRGAVLRLVGPAHQYLPKPCDPDLLRETILRAAALRDLLVDAQLAQLVTQIQTLPSVPTVFMEMSREMRAADPSIVKIGHLISQDFGLCTKMLQLVNSAFFGLQQPISNPVEAIIHLGLETVKNLVLSLQLFSVFDGVQLRHFSIRKLWNHSWTTAAIAKRIVEAENHSDLGNQAFIAGLVHDVGKFVLAVALPQAYQETLDACHQGSRPLCEVERERFGASHAEIGAYLLALWGLPAAVVQAVALHHRPDSTSSSSFSVLTALHVANVLEHERSRSADTPASAPLDANHLARIGLKERVGAWRELTANAGEKHAA
ncbi:MAG: hypothetical protein QOF48_2771 [Verrucomicrobiota bacterium]|jgi:HD-like signal output (HDOD) protein